MDDDIAFLELWTRIPGVGRTGLSCSRCPAGDSIGEHFGSEVGLIDLDLKGEGGLSLMRNLRESFPDLPIIAISGVLGEL